MPNDYSPLAPANATPKKGWPEVLVEALKEYDRAWQKDESNCFEAYEDLRFRRGKLQDQWTPQALQVRTGRPCHVVNKLPQFIRQVTGDMRQSRPGIKVVPVDDSADVQTAEVRGGLIRYIENRSDAAHVYTAAADSQVTAGIGHWQVTTEYSGFATFNQEIRIAPIDDGVSVLWDADAVLPDRSDANHCFVPHDLTRAAFKEQFPNAIAEGFDTATTGIGATSAFDNWHTDEYVRMMVYWKKKPIVRTLALAPDGGIRDLTELAATDKNAFAQLSQQIIQMGGQVQQRNSYRICRYLLTLVEVLEEKDWPGMHIPVIPLIGEEVKIGRDIYRHGIVRYARDLQRMVNYYASAETEIIALQPKSPWIGTKKMFEAHYDQWENANVENLPFLEYTTDPTAPGGKPERNPPPMPSQAVQLGAQNAVQNMKEVIGIYNAGLGQPSNETSGIAIRNRQREGDTGTFVYQDNMALAIKRTGTIINDLIPYIYDTQRQLHIIGDDSKSQIVTINKPGMMNGESVIENDLTTGAYDVMVEEGPGYTTRREEMRDGMQAFLQAFPAAAPVLGDLFAEAQDWPHAQEIGERLQELLPPPIKSKLEAEQQQKMQAQGKPPPPPSPQQAMQMQQAAQQKQMADQAAALEMQGKQADSMKTQAEARKAAAEADRAEIEAQIMKQQLAVRHMTALHGIAATGHPEADQAQSHERHVADMVTKGVTLAQRLVPQPDSGEPPGQPQE